MDFHGFYTGKIFDAYQYLGAHITDAGVVFRTLCSGSAEGFADWRMQPMAGIRYESGL